MTIGIICEYNPFHNGHLYQINKIKEMYPNSTIICIMSGNYTERGDVSIINKWDKTDIALECGIDLVIELPFVFSSQSADIFAKGSINILNHLKVDYLVFGSETNDIDLLDRLADIQLNNSDYNLLVKDYLDKGLNYPTAMSKALEKISKVKIELPNDLLGLSYIKELKKLNSPIKPISIKRTSDYHSLDLDKDIVSASSIRNAIINNKDISKYVPSISYKYLNKDIHFINDYFDLFKYKVITTKDLSIYQTVDEGIEFRIQKYINECHNFDELISFVKTKRYTYNKLYRMFIHILCNFTKEEALNNNVTYIRILGFNDKGKKYLNSIKKELDIPLVTTYSNLKDKMLDIEYRVNNIYNLNNNDLIKREIKGPIIK